MLHKYLLNEFMNFCPRQEPWDLALFTQTCYMKLAKIKLPFLEEIGFGSPMHLKICTTKKDALLPSAECKCHKNYFHKLQILFVILLIIR